ncbi:MAG: sulfite exporter TauE/SafE family protein [Bauldia sp.]
MIEFVIFAAVGFLAQLVDGALGMAYGVTCTSVLLAFGVPPAHASASVHAAEVFTTAASGASHVWHRNVDWRLVGLLAPAGVVGGVFGTYVLTGIAGAAIRPFVTAYLAAIGAFIVVKAMRPFPERPISGWLVVPLGGAGGFVDAVGGGGWGPVVTSSLIGSGGAPRLVIGSVNAVEFVVTLSVSLTFLFALLSGHWEDAGNVTDHLPAVGGLIVGGIVAAPLAGYVIKIVATPVLTAVVGLLILTLAAYQTWQLLH